MSAEAIPGASPAAPATVAVPVIERQRMRLAWLTIWGALLAFILLCAGVSAGGYIYATRASEQHTALLEQMHGSLLEVQRAGRRDWTVVLTGGLTLDEGDAVRTGPNTDALITLFDHSTLQLYYGSEVMLSRLRTSRYLDQEKTIEIEQRQGVVLYSMSDPSPYAALHAGVRTAQADVALGDNTTARVSLVDATPGNAPYTLVVLKFGRAAVREGDAHAQLVPDEQVRAYAGGTLHSPEPASDELLANGKFEDPPQDPDEAWAGWTIDPVPVAGTASGAQVITHTGGIELQSTELTRAANQTGAQWVVLKQDLAGQQVAYYRTLALTLSVKVVDQAVDTSPSGPYPLTVRMHYYDQSGQEHIWEHGFYYAGPGMPPAPDDRSATVVQKGAWQKWSFDLKSLASSDMSRLGWLEVRGSGAQFSVWVTDLSLIGQ